MRALLLLHHPPPSPVVRHARAMMNNYVANTSDPLRIVPRKSGIARSNGIMAAQSKAQILKMHDIPATADNPPRPHH